MKYSYVIIRREPHGEAVDTLILGSAMSAADAEEFILSMAEDYGYFSFCMALDSCKEEVSFEEAQEFGHEAITAFITNCNILKTLFIEEG